MRWRGMPMLIIVFGAVVCMGSARQVMFHPKYPLFASASDDGTARVFHGRVFNDFVTNPVIVPVKILKAHKPQEYGLGTLDCCWHPTQPWLFTSGADRQIVLFQNVP